MFFAYGIIWCVAGVSSVSPSSEQIANEGLTLETSATHHIPQAKNIPYQPLLIKPVFSLLANGEKTVFIKTSLHQHGGNRYSLEYFLIFKEHRNHDRIKVLSNYFFCQRNNFLSSQRKTLFVSRFNQQLIYNSKFTVIPISATWRLLNVYDTYDVYKNLF